MPMQYSYNMKREGLIFAQAHDVNASYKDLAAVCDAVRYAKAKDALSILDGVISMKMPIAYRRHNKYMGARHELQGRKGAWPVKAAKEVRTVIVNAIANAANEAKDGEEMYIAHAAANKTNIERRLPPRGSSVWGRGTYRSHRMYSDLEFAKIEIGLCDGNEENLPKRMKQVMKFRQRAEAQSKKPAVKTAPEKKTVEKRAEKKVEAKKSA